MRRSQQYAGINGDADIVGVPGLHVEVKRQEKMDMYGAMEQAHRDAAEDDVPIVMHRKNRRPWVVIVQTDDLLEFCRTVVAAAEQAPITTPKPVKKAKRAVRVRRPSAE
jgi:hypothetical protein